LTPRSEKGVGTPLSRSARNATGYQWRVHENGGGVVGWGEEEGEGAGEGGEEGDGGGGDDDVGGERRGGASVAADAAAAAAAAAAEAEDEDEAAVDLAGVFPWERGELRRGARWRRRRLPRRRHVDAGRDVVDVIDDDDVAVALTFLIESARIGARPEQFQQLSGFLVSRSPCSATERMRRERVMSAIFVDALFTRAIDCQRWQRKKKKESKREPRWRSCFFFFFIVGSEKKHSLHFFSLSRLSRRSWFLQKKMGNLCSRVEVVADDLYSRVRFLLESKLTSGTGGREAERKRRHRLTTKTKKKTALSQFSPLEF
jgi:hypothetical protein